MRVWFRSYGAPTVVAWYPAIFRAPGTRLLPWEWFFRKLKRERELNCSVAHKARDCRAMALLHTVCLFLSFLYSLTTVGKSNDNGSKLASSSSDRGRSTKDLHENAN